MNFLIVPAPLWLPAGMFAWDEGARAAYMVCPSRGDWWNDANACGEAGPAGKKLAMGEDGGDE